MENNMENLQVRKIIRQLKKNSIQVCNIPEEYENNPQVVAYERKAGLRLTVRKGFDIISNSFFVEEDLFYSTERKKKVTVSFNDFDSYYTFLNGDIYDNACYTFCHLSDDIINRYKINLNKLLQRKAFVDCSIDNYSLALSNEEIDQYEKAEQIHKQCKLWTTKFNNCNNYDEFVQVVNNYKKSKLSPIIDIIFFFFNYIFKNIEDNKRFSIIMEYVSSNAYPSWLLINALCSIYNPEDVIHSYKNTTGTKNTLYKHKKKLKEYIERLNNGEIKFYKKAFFDKNTHYYCETISGFQDENRRIRVSTIHKYFETFDEFIEYRKGDLTYCDLTSAYKLDIDASKYIINETTKLPTFADSTTTYRIEKGFKNGKFHIRQTWCNKFGAEIKVYKHTFDYFFDFVTFLNGDLTNADLLFCNGLMYLQEWKDINLTGAKMKSELNEKFGLECNTYTINENLIETFECIEKNEFDTLLALQTSRDSLTERTNQNLTSVHDGSTKNSLRVHYISDIHLIHKILKSNCRSLEDILYVIKNIVNTIVNETGSLLLIAGDVASDFEIFQLFVNELAKSKRPDTIVVFILGNHELWSFPNSSINDIVLTYRIFLRKHGMYLLHNDILYSSYNGAKQTIHILEYEKLCELDDIEIIEHLRNAKHVILGGLGFSGYNPDFNANNGIYRDSVDRNTEIKESQKFEALYIRLQPIINKKNTIILTHTPKKDWSNDSVYSKNYIYVSGHTHRNSFYDDSVYRVYSDNQIGYHNINPHLKSFLMDNDYDCFSDYADGIYKITREQYKDFYRGKNIPMTFQRKTNIIYMLKKNGNYCFIHENKDGKLMILNGGAMKKLAYNEVQYYYDQMDMMISTIETPLNKFTEFQMHIAKMVKEIGGAGTIHGCIIDIDFYNHIYVNPMDLTVIGYWASDIVNKIIYPSVPALLKKECPNLFEKYIKLLKENKENVLVLVQKSEIESKPQVYLDTEIYKASREIKKMQKVYSNILNTWYDDIQSKKTQNKLT